MLTLTLRDARDSQFGLYSSFDIMARVRPDSRRVIFHYTVKERDGFLRSHTKTVLVLAATLLSESPRCIVSSFFYNTINEV